ncbi:MAG: peptide deformylase [Candidatus Buchananbacteria bacterium]
MLKIITIPDPILRKKSAQLLIREIKSKEIQELIPEMIKTMHKSDGVGLAAPQIGKSIRLVVIRHKDGDLVIFNPKFLRKSLAKEMGEEGCLSVPLKYGMVKRHKKIILKYIDQNGEQKKITAEGLLARVIQHEADHLDGILFIDKAIDITELK